MKFTIHLKRLDGKNHLGAYYPLLGEFLGENTDTMQTLPFEINDDASLRALKSFECHGESIVIPDEENADRESQETT